MGISKKMSELLETAEPLKPHQEAYIKTVGTLTGSKAFGVAQGYSDYDYIILSSQFKGMRLDVYDCLSYDKDELYAFEGYRSWYVKCADGAVLNLLVMDNEYYRAQFVYATEGVVAFAKESEDFREKIKNKDFRCGAFQALKLVYSERVV